MYGFFSKGKRSANGVTDTPGGASPGAGGVIAGGETFVFFRDREPSSPAAWIGLRFFAERRAALRKIFIIYLQEEGYLLNWIEFFFRRLLRTNRAKCLCGLEKMPISNLDHPVLMHYSGNRVEKSGIEWKSKQSLIENTARNFQDSGACSSARANRCFRVHPNWRWTPKVESPCRRGIGISC